MNLQQIGKKYKVSENFLNSKDDALSVAATSIDDLVFKLQYNVPKEELIENLKTLSSFLRDVKKSTF
jgi:hypothetical protein